MQSRAEEINAKINKRVEEVTSKQEEIAEKLVNNVLDTLEKVVDELTDAQGLELETISFKYETVANNLRMIHTPHEATGAYTDGSETSIEYSTRRGDLLIGKELFEIFLGKISTKQYFSVEPAEDETYVKLCYKPE